ncbi:hypothetical protein A3715_17475 [Oleiphilus sp. HI0009]|nr:hypothetical protein A3715_17475 [Oleiphilus sp. HI0009]
MDIKREWKSDDEFLNYLRWQRFIYGGVNALIISLSLFLVIGIIFIVEIDAKNWYTAEKGWYLGGIMVCLSIASVLSIIGYLPHYLHPLALPMAPIVGSLLCIPYLFEMGKRVSFRIPVLYRKKSKLKVSRPDNKGCFRIETSEGKWFEIKPMTKDNINKMGAIFPLEGTYEMKVGNSGNKANKNYAGYSFRSILLKMNWYINTERMIKPSLNK